MEREPSSARRTVTSLATRAAEVREFLSPPLSVASGLAERAAPTSVLAFVLPSCVGVGAPARSLSFFLLSFVRVALLSLSLFLSFGR